MASSPTVSRSLAAATALLLPAAVALWSRVSWSGELPSAIGTHWSSPGPADRATPTDEFFAGTFTVSVIFAIAGATIALLPIRPLVKRVALLGAGSVSAIAACQWLVSGWLTLQAGDPFQSVIGAWILVHFASWTYGVLPSLLAPPTPHI